MPLSRPRLAISLGDPNGVGPEVVLKTFADPRLAKYVRPVLVGSEAVLRFYAERLGLADLAFAPVTPDGLGGAPEDALPVLDLPDAAFEVTPGRPTPESGRLAMFAVEVACDLCLEGLADGMVTAPISKEAISMAGYEVPGHTEFLAARTRTADFTMLLVSGDLRVGLVTTHLPLARVAPAVTEGAVLAQIQSLHRSLQRDFGKGQPRIAVLGLNPHAGDGGVLGHEEQTVIAPAIQDAVSMGIGAAGPFPADGFFGRRGFAHYDAVLAMYHDQGLAPFKALAMGSGVNFTAGLPIVRTSPDHGTGYDIAGRGEARPDSFRQAVYLAVDVARRRARTGGRAPSVPAPVEAA